MRPWEVLTQDKRTIFCIDRRAGDDPDLSQLLPGIAPIQRMHQVHGCSIRQVMPDSDPAITQSADAMVATGGAVSLLVRTADCVPVVLWDHDLPLTAVIHAGWKGFVAGVVPATIESLVAAGASNLRAWVGPSICGACYPVGIDVQAQVVAVCAATQSVTDHGQPSVSIALGVIDQLQQSQVAVVGHDARCTLQTQELYSARGGDQVQRIQIVVAFDG